MNCREKILSEDYMSILLDYVPEEANQEDEAFCYQQVDGTLGIYYLDRSAVLPLSPVNYLYRYLPQLFCLGAFPAAGSRTFRTEPLEGSGILAQQRPPLELTGRRVVMAFIDTGISYENPVFRYSDGSSRILAIWDQTDQSGQSPEGFLYGTEYVREQIDRALELEDPHSLVPEKMKLDMEPQWRASRREASGRGQPVYRRSAGLRDCSSQASPGKTISPGLLSDRG